MERWLPVVGSEGVYEVSDQGRVRSVDHAVERRLGRGPTPDATYVARYRGQLRKLYVTDAGYAQVKIAGRGALHVHTLVLEAFIGPAPEGHQAQHHDNDGSKNWLTNLRWGTPKENADDRGRHGNHCFGEKQGAHKLSENDVVTIRRMVGHHSDGAIARQYGVTPENVRRIRLCQTWKHLSEEAA